MKTLRKHNIAFDFVMAAVGLAGLWLLLNGQLAITIAVGLILLAVSGIGAVVYHSHTVLHVRRRASGR